jgi:hypothetical protein
LMCALNARNSGVGVFVTLGIPPARSLGLLDHRLQGSHTTSGQRRNRVQLRVGRRD